MIEIVHHLASLTRPPRPATWSHTLAPAMRRAAAAQVKHAAQAVEQGPLADAIALVNPTRLATRVVAAALPVIGRLASLGRELRGYLDSNLNELRDAVRAAEGATLEPEFASSMQAVERLLPMAEQQVERVDVLVADIMATLTRLGAIDYVATGYQIPAPLAGFIQEPTAAR
jgi:hypothetical protein